MALHSEKRKIVKKEQKINDECRPNDFCINFVQNLCHLSLLKTYWGCQIATHSTSFRICKIILAPMARITCDIKCYGKRKTKIAESDLAVVLLTGWKWFWIGFSRQYHYAVCVRCVRPEFLLELAFVNFDWQLYLPQCGLQPKFYINV